MVSASDIITYIGVPLTVIGVLPIFYTSLKSLRLRSKIQARLRHNNVATASVRGSLVSGIIELEMERKSIAPWPSDDPRYWAVTDASHSALPGGSWTVLMWNERSLGTKRYRPAYLDELRQPPAEIGFEELVSYLMVRGAVPCVKGIGKLASAGLWAPSATTHVLLSPDTTEPVLTVTQPDDASGYLCLKLRWRKEWGQPGRESLPPGWMRITNGHGNYVNLSITVSGVTEAFKEGSEKGIRNISHLSVNASNSNKGAGAWFASTASGSGLIRTSIHNYSCPEAILQFAEAASIPSGVLVLLGFIGADEAPAWDLPPPDRAAFARKQFQQSHSQRMLEMKLPPTHAEAARIARQHNETQAFLNNSREMSEQQVRWQEQRPLEALKSMPFGVDRLARMGFKWLRRGEVGAADVDADRTSNETETLLDDETGHGQNAQITENTTKARHNKELKEIIENVLYDMVVDAEAAQGIAAVLNRWRTWTESGVMSRQDTEYLGKHQPEFAKACCMLHFIKAARTSVASQVTRDLQECLRTFRTVRLG